MEGGTDEEYFTPIATHLTLPLVHGRTDGGSYGQTGGTNGQTAKEYFTPIAAHLTLPLAHGRMEGGMDRRDGGRDGQTVERTDGRGIFYTYCHPPHPPTCPRM